MARLAFRARSFGARFPRYPRHPPHPAMAVTLDRIHSSADRVRSHRAAGSSGRSGLSQRLAHVGCLHALRSVSGNPGARQHALLERAAAGQLPLVFGGLPTPAARLRPLAALAFPAAPQPPTTAAVQPPEGAANNIAPLKPTPADHESLVKEVHGPEDWEALLKDSDGKLVIVMCKAKTCRPCKMFSRKYARFAEQFGDTVFAEIVGDESKETRQMMIQWQVKATPTFRYLRNGELVATTSGINEDKFRGAVVAALQPHESGYAAPEVTSA